MKLKNIITAAIIPLLLVIAVSWTGKTVYTKAQKILDSGEATADDISEKGDYQVTLADVGRPISMRAGEALLLDLGEEYDWHIRVSDAEVISRQYGPVIPRGAQGLYAAHQPGRAVFTINGYPVCRKSDPPCGQNDLEFSFDAIVQP